MIISTTGNINVTDCSGLPFLGCYNYFLKKLSGKSDERSIEWPFKEFGALFCLLSSSRSKKTIKGSEDVCILQDRWSLPQQNA